MNANIKWLDNPEIFRVNQLDAHSDHSYYVDYADMKKKDNPLSQSLNGQWAFAFSKNAASRPCDFYKEGFDDSGFDKLQKLNIFRIIQEALHNVSKHSKAHNVKVELVKEKSLVQVRIVDDGVGVTVTEDGKIQRGLGLNSMEYRANQIGAVFEIRKNDPAGTCIEVQLKLE